MDPYPLCSRNSIRGTSKIPMNRDIKLCQFIVTHERYYHLRFDLTEDYFIIEVKLN